VSLYNISKEILLSRIMPAPRPGITADDPANLENWQEGLSENCFYLLIGLGYSICHDSTQNYYK
jgi:hypothetical protein